MPPRAARATQPDADDAEAGPGPSGQVIAEYVPWCLQQTLMDRGYLPEAEVKTMVRRMLNTNNDEAYMTLLAKVNNDVKYLDFAILRIRLPADKQWYVCFLETAKDETSKTMGSRYSIEQREFFRAVVDAIGGAEPDEDEVLAAVSQITLINLNVRPPSPPPGAATQAGTQAGTQAAARSRLNHRQREEVLAALAQDGWLYEARAGYYTLGPRTLIELKELVLEALPEDRAERLRVEYL